MALFGLIAILEVRAYLADFVIFLCRVVLIPPHALLHGLPTLKISDLKSRSRLL